MTDAHRLQPDHAPTPFSAAEIRAGCQPPRTITLRIEPAGATPFIRVNRSEQRFWFAKTLPGMPVRMESWEDGVRTFRMAMLENVPGATLGE